MIINKTDNMSAILYVGTDTAHVDIVGSLNNLSTVICNAYLSDYKLDEDERKELIENISRAYIALDQITQIYSIEENELNEEIEREQKRTKLEINKDYN